MRVGEEVDQDDDTPMHEVLVQHGTLHTHHWLRLHPVDGPSTDVGDICERGERRPPLALV